MSNDFIDKRIDLNGLAGYCFLATVYIQACY